jgi:hypothetical protein
MAVVRSKNISPSWSDVKTALLDFDRAGLRGLVQDLYTASKDNRAFLHARLGLGHDQLGPFKASISRWISPDLMERQTGLGIEAAGQVDQCTVCKCYRRR